MLQDTDIYILNISVGLTPQKHVINEGYRPNNYKCFNNNCITILRLMPNYYVIALPK